MSAVRLEPLITHANELRSRIPSREARLKQLQVGNQCPPSRRQYDKERSPTAPRPPHQPVTGRSGLCNESVGEGGWSP